MRMRTATFHMKSLGPMVHGKPLPEKPDDVSPIEHEENSWKLRAHINKDGYMYIPAMALRNCLFEAACYRGDKIPGKGNATWRKHFESGLLVPDDMPTQNTWDDIIKWTLFVPADGKPGGGKRVWRSFPRVDSWEADATVLVLDPAITQKAFEQHLWTASMFIGLGTFRARNRGQCGRFAVSNFTWTEEEN